MANKTRVGGLGDCGNFRCALGSKFDAWWVERLSLGPVAFCFTPLVQLLLFNQGGAEAFKIVHPRELLGDC